MAGFSDAPFRYIAKLCGADVLVSEMVSADGVKRHFEQMRHYTHFTEFERPFGIQLFGDNPTVMANATALLVKLRPDFFDINMGCPVKKVVKRFAGCALMTKPDLAEGIIRQMNHVLTSEGIPLTVKIRSGWDANTINAVEFAQMAQSAGASAIIVHPRTRSQGYSGHSDWDVIRQVKSAVTCPVVGNGDITTPTEATEMLQQTGCDSIMIGRAALGQPWIFSHCVGDGPVRPASIVGDGPVRPASIVGDGPVRPASVEQKLALIYQHIDLVVAHNCGSHALVPMRAHFAFYTKGLAGGAAARQIINRSTDPNQIKHTIRELYYGRLSAGDTPSQISAEE